MKLEFSGAARNVTGSKHLMHINGKKILLDCGLFQGRRKQTIYANMNFPFDASSIDAVVLSHAHIDHCGTLPYLVKKGFSGPIYCTPATQSLCEIMLMDSGYIQEKDAEYVKKKLKDPDAEPLYTIEDARAVMPLFKSIPYGVPFAPAPGTTVRFHDAGHILGSAMEEWDIEDRDTGQTIRFGFTGDLGRKDLPILKDPAQLENLDVLITESTYGNRLHDEIIDVEDQLVEVVKRTADRGGKIFVPAFAVERTQEVLYVLRMLMDEGKMPAIPIYVDSPLATSATQIFRKHKECFDSELREMLEDGQDPFCPDCGDIFFTRSVEESKALNETPGPFIVISANGMCEAGRIRHHLKNSIGDVRHTVMVVGYMAENTLGRKLVDGVSPVKIFGDPYPVRCETKIFNAFSGHADQKGLLHFAANVGNPKDIFLVHGEEKSMLTFRDRLEELDNLEDAEVHIPSPGHIFELQPGKKWKKLHEVNHVSEMMFGEKMEPLGTTDK